MMIATHGRNLRGSSNVLFYIWMWLFIPFTVLYLNQSASAASATNHRRFF